MSGEVDLSQSLTQIRQELLTERMSKKERKAKQRSTQKDLGMDDEVSRKMLVLHIIVESTSNE